VIEKFAPVDLGVNLDSQSEADRVVIRRCVEAGAAMHEIFWRQTWSGAVALRDRLRAAGEGRALEEVELMMGPYDRLKDHEPFMDGVPRKPEGAGFYPDDVTKAELEAWVAAHPQDREAFESLHTIIRREGDRLKAIPYHEAYRDLLEPAARALREAADQTENATLARFLRSRADAFLSDDYYQSDLDWMNVEDNVVDVTIGPYETYEDMLMGAKTSYESYVGVVDARESANLQTYARYLDSVDQRLTELWPFEIKRGGASPIRVVNLVYNSGEARAGVQTTAFNLPNDERVHQAKGTRKVMLRNVAQAKFEKSMIPIAERVLAPEDLQHVTFDAYFTNVLLHEMAHGLGPSFLNVSGDGLTTVRKCLRELYSPIEEAKADIVGLFFHQWLMDEGIVPKEEVRAVYTSFLAGFFRSIRFGMTEAHGRANVLELSYLQQRGSVRVEDGRYKIDFSRIAEDVASLARDLIRIEAVGSYEEAKAFLERYDKPDPSLLGALKRLEDVPVDIRPRYQVEPVSVG